MNKFIQAVFVFLLFIAIGFPSTGGGHIFVLNKQADSLSIVDAKSVEVIASIQIGREPHELAITPDGGKIYVSNVGDDSISVFDLETLAETKKIISPEFSFPHGIAFIPDAKIALVTSERAQKIVIIDSQNDEILRSIDTKERGTHMVVSDSIGRWAYFTNRDSDSVSVMDLENFSLVAVIPVGSGAEGIALSPDNTQLWTGDRRGNTVTVIDTKSREVIEQLPAGNAPMRVAFSPDGTKVFVSNSASADVWIYDAETREHIDSVNVGGRPAGIVFADDGAMAYVASGTEGAVYVIDTLLLTVTEKVAVGRGPDGITYRILP